jgi:hypothetical protein
LLNYVIGFFFFKEKEERNQHSLAIGSCSHTATLKITATTQQGLSLTISNLISLINRGKPQHAKPSGAKSVTSHLTRKK